jgi:6,7-dimethyl-8-ribityllumazine synthase
MEFRMTRVIEGHLVDPGGRFAIVASRFNELIVSRLLAGALDGLRRHGIDPEERADIIWVPGAYEVPVTVLRAAKTEQYEAVIALGAVIRGSTPHFDMVAGEVTKGVATASMQTGVPCIFGVLTVDSIEQAIERAGTKAGNAGYTAACSAIEMASLFARWGA